jgi:rhamnosyl/mannosyltransferase
VGRLVYYKGLEHLIEALALLREIRLVVVGRGPLENACRAQVERLKLSARVSFLGKLPDEQLRTLYCACQCLVLPSVARSEAFGMVLAEAMASGRPVISTELSTGTSFVNLDGETGFVVPPGNVGALAEKIGLLLENRELREELGRKARRRVEGFFRQEVMVDNTLKLYQEALA